MNKGLRQNVISFCRNPLFAGYILFYSYFLKSKRTIFIFIILFNSGFVNRTEKIFAKIAAADKKNEEKFTFALLSCFSSFETGSLPDEPTGEKFFLFSFFSKIFGVWFQSIAFSVIFDYNVK